MKKAYIYIIIILFCISSMFFTGIKDVKAFTVITAQEAFNMLNNDQAILIDVRSIEEYQLVGNASLVSSGEPIAYLIPWMDLNGFDENGNNIFKKNPDFTALIEQTFDDKNQPLIIMCGSGYRSTYAAKHIEEIGYLDVYEIDNILKELTNPPGGCGGFEGSDYNGLFNGYKGYPDRINSNENISSQIEIKVQFISDEIENENDSVAWMDSGLPITHKINTNLIPKIKKIELSKPNNNINSRPPVPFTNYQVFPDYFWQPTNLLYQNQVIKLPISEGGYFSSPWQSIEPESNKFSWDVSFNNYKVQTPSTLSQTPLTWSYDEYTELGRC